MEAYNEQQGQRSKRKGSFKDAVAQFAPGINIPGVTE